VTGPNTVWESLAAMIARAAERFGDQPAIVDGDRRTTWAELVDRSQDFAAALVASGVERGDRVAIWAFNSTEWVTAFYGLLQAGAALVPINTRFKGSEAADVLSRSGARVLVTVTDFLGTDYVEMLRATGVELPDLATIVVAHGAAPEGAVGWDDFIGRATAEGREEVTRRTASLGPDDPSDILFTSGTTGRSKGVVSTNSRTLVVSTDWVDMAGLRQGDRYLQVNPYFHMFGLKAGLLASAAAGATMYPEAVFDVDVALRRVQDERITVFPGAPTIYQTILDHPERERYDLSSLRVAVTGAADIPVKLIERIFAELPFQLVVSGYGLTEGGTAAATGPDDDAETIATTVGWPRPGFELRIVGADGEDLPAEEAGEVVVRSPSVMLHYLDDPEATAEALSADGWLSTGDLGVIDQRGCLRIVGRVKDMFIVGGFNAYPAEIENALLRHPEVAQAAVIGIPDERLGEVGMAFAVLTPGSTLSEADLIAWSREEMANYKVPRRVVFLETLPLNATGKVVKDELRKRASA
jgi:acyl-CoA synthetase (AMP-forming)/AMP-acid ligase II